METENSNLVNERTETKLKAAATILSVLLLAALGWGAYTFNQADTLKDQNGILSAEKAALVVQRDQLQTEVTQMGLSLEETKAAFYAASERADSMQIKSNSLENEISVYRNQAATVPQLRSQIQSLKSEKNNIANQLANYRQRINALESENGQLKGMVVELREANQNLQNNLAQNTQAVKEVVAPEATKAEITRVDVKNRRDKLKVKARRARSVTVLFDLPENLRGTADETVYLSISDLKMRPIESETKQTIRVEAKGEFNPVVYHASKKINFQNNPQKISMEYEVTEKLKSGVYIASLYTDKVYLGKIEFSLR